MENMRNKRYKIVENTPKRLTNKLIIREFERDRQGIGRKLAEYAKQKDELQAELEKMQQLAEERKKWEEEQKEKKQDGLGSEQLEDKGSGSTDRKEEAPTADPDKVMKLLSSYGLRQEQEIQELENEDA